MWLFTAGKHCGGKTIDKLEDGTEYGWKPAAYCNGGKACDAGIEACKQKCRASKACNAFVWRDSDKGCFWKSGVSGKSHTGMAGHDCYFGEFDGPSLSSGFHHSSDRPKH